LGGLTCVLAENLDREAIFRALKARHFYATTGNRLLMDLTVKFDDGCSGLMGDILTVGTENPCLNLRIVGTAPIESVEVRNGLELIHTIRPYCEKDLGNRIKVIWSGAEVRGRDRLVSWDGSLKVQGNSILKVEPINFWNANRPLRQSGQDQLSWHSVTTGGLAGVIITLEKPDPGKLSINTTQLNTSCQISSIGLQPRVWDCGGLRKDMRVYRLPDQGRSIEYSCQLPLTDLNKGDNPIYIRVTQEDGHLAWSSPVYLVK
jgi:hypothetical protein